MTARFPAVAGAHGADVDGLKQTGQAQFAPGPGNLLRSEHVMLSFPAGQEAGERLSPKFAGGSLGEPG